MYKREVMVTNKTGLHARPAAEFVKTASKYKSDIRVNFKEKIFNAKSIIGILSAGIVSGSNITISADGIDEKDAVEGLVKLLESNFGEV